jgi:hypothetical protein
VVWIDGERQGPGGSSGRGRPGHSAPPSAAPAVTLRRRAEALHLPAAPQLAGAA